MGAINGSLGSEISVQLRQEFIVLPFGFGRANGLKWFGLSEAISTRLLSCRIFESLTISVLFFAVAGHKSSSLWRVQNLSHSCHEAALSRVSRVSGSPIARSYLERPPPHSRRLPTKPQLQQDRHPLVSAYPQLDDGIRAKKARSIRRASTSS